MKNISIHSLSLLIGLFFLGAGSTGLAQDKKFRARVSAQYVKIMNRESSIRLSVKYKGDDGFEPATDLMFEVYRVIGDDSLTLLGKTITNDVGKAIFNLNEINLRDSSFHFSVTIKNDSRFEDNETSIDVLDADLTAEVQTIDSTYQITATLKNVSGSPLPGQLLTVGLQRMFAPLHIGDEFYETDENGTIVVPLRDRMPGINGLLTFEVSLNESEQYGTIKALVSASIGTTVKDESTFNQRTMWSPPSKTPFYLLIFPNLIILGVWVPIMILIINLFRISKAKINS